MNKEPPASPVTDDDAHSAAAAETSRQDPTERSGESEARLRAIFETVVDGIITIDRHGRIETFNPGAERIFGYKAAEAIGQNVSILMPEPYRSGHDGYIDRYQRTGERRIIGIGREVVGIRKDGSLFPLDLAVSESRVGERVFYTGLIRDITERKVAEAALQIREWQQKAVVELSQHALAGCDFDRLMNDAVARAAQILDVEFSKILELDSTGDELVLCAGVGWQPSDLGVWRVAGGHESQAGYTLLVNAPVLVEDIAKETRFRAAPLLVQHGVASGISVVIHGRARPFGVLAAHGTRPRKFSKDDVHFLQSLAGVLAAAIERRQLEAELLDSIGREQRRIGQDLHDDLCQRLTGIAFRADAVSAELSPHGPAAREVAEIAEHLRAANEQARMLARGLAPVELEANGLMSALEELAANCLQLHRVECQFRCETPLLLASHVTAMHLYRIAQEAISNAVRHGHARSIMVELAHRGDEGLLTITNDGLPLPAERARSGGMGLRIMQYRAEMMGATIRLASTADGKTALLCAFRTDR